MTLAKGTLKNGQIVLDSPTNWPEGCRVVVEPEAVHGLNGSADDEADDAQSISRWLAEFDAIPAWQMTSAEEAEWQAARQAVKDYTLAKMSERLPEALP